MNNARSAALSALMHVDVNEGYSNLVLDKTLAALALDPRDKALAAAIFYGVLERRITLDYVISCFSSTPLKKLSPVVLEVLRMGAYQILYMEKIPKSAAVNESVTLAKENHAAKASGFINAVLRSLLRQPEKAALPDEKTRPLLFLSVKYSFPEWLISLWQKSYGAECTLSLLESCMNRPPVFARVNNTRISEENLLERLPCEGIAAKAVPWLENAVELENTGSVSASKAFQEGLFHIQDLSSQLCSAVLNPFPGCRVIDVCSAPGGKAFTLAEIMENRGELLAFDQYRGKVGLIRQGAQRLGLSAVQAEVRDALNPKETLAPADRVLCDAPCSGLGIIRRKPEIRYKNPSVLDSLPDLQYRILCKSSELVKSGGILVYSTCTLNPKENGEVAAEFLKNNSKFVPLPIPLPARFARACSEPENQLTMMPHINGTDGFFVAAFQKKQE